MIVRPYQPTDRAAVERICHENGLRGQRDQYFCDGELFARIWLNPFLKGEPEHTWVAERDGEIVGYLVASIRPNYLRRAILTVLPDLALLLGRWLRGQYRQHPPSQRFVRWFFSRCWREVPKSPKSSSNFHFNVADGARGASFIGNALMNVYFAELRARGIKEFYIQVFAAAGQRNVNFYRKIGFNVGDVVLCTLFHEPTAIATMIRPTPTKDVVGRDGGTRKIAKLGVVFEWDGRAPLEELRKSLAQQVLPADEVLLEWTEPVEGWEVVPPGTGDSRLASEIKVRRPAQSLRADEFARIVAQYESPLMRKKHGSLS